MESRNTHSTLTLTGRIDQRTHELSDLTEKYDSWDSMSEKQKLDAARNVDPVETQTVYNITTDRLHQYFVDNLDVGQTSSKDNIDAAWMALGTDAASGTSSSDTDLNTRTYSETITDHADNGKDLLASTFLDSTEANGNTFDEIGLFTGDPANLGNNDVFMINHADFANVTKDNTKTVTFDVTLTFSDV